jgi:hypothetical protein
MEGEDLISNKSFLALLRRPADYGDAVAQQMQNAVDQESSYFTKESLAVADDLPEDALLPLAPPWRGVDYKTRGAMMFELATDLARPEALRPWIQSAVGLITPIHQEVLRRMQQRPAVDPLGPTVELAEAGVVDFGGLPWRAILKLRASSFIEEFRDRMSAIREAGPGGVVDHLWRDLWRFAEANQPSPLRTAVGGILGNLPISPVNPYSVVEAIQATRRALGQRTQFGWLYFILEAAPGLSSVEQT